MSAPNMHRKVNIFCSNCGTETSWGDKETIVIAWNRRTQPGNKPLSLEQLKSMDREPVWMVDGAGHTTYGIVNSEGCADADYGKWDIDFYGMPGDGKYDLHRLGWLAYAHKPEQEEK